MENLESNSDNNNVVNPNVKETLEALNDTLTEQKEALEGIYDEADKMVRNFYNKTIQSNLSCKVLDNLDKSYDDLLKVIQYQQFLISSKNNIIQEFTQKNFCQTTPELDCDSKADPLFTRW